MSRQIHFERFENGWDPFAQLGEKTCIFVRMLHSLCSLKNYLTDLLKILYFRGQKVHCWHSYLATMFEWLRKSNSTSGSRVTDDSVLWMFEMFTLFMFSRSWNPVLIFLQSCHVWVTSKIQVDFRFNTYSGYWWMCFIDSWDRFTIHVFDVKESIADISTELHTLFGWPQKSKSTSVRFKGDSKVLMIVSHGFYNVLTIYVVKVNESTADIPTELTMFEWPRKSKSTSGSRGTGDSVLYIFEISKLFMFSRSGNALLIFLQIYHVRVTSKIQVDFRFKRYSEEVMIVSYRFLKFLHYLCVWGQEILCWSTFLRSNHCLGTSKI